MPTGLGSRPTFSCSHPRSSRYISFARQWRSLCRTFAAAAPALETPIECQADASGRQHRREIVCPKVCLGAGPTDGDLCRRGEEPGDTHSDERIAPRAREGGAVGAESHAEKSRADAQGERGAPVTDLYAGLPNVRSAVSLHFKPDLLVGEPGERSEERRVGKECRS